MTNFQIIENAKKWIRTGWGLGFENISRLEASWLSGQEGREIGNGVYDLVSKEIKS